MLLSPIQIVRSGPGIDLSGLPEGLSVKMADPVKDFAYARNAVTLVYDLSLYERVTLAFEAKEFGDEPHEPPPNPFADEVAFDGVAVSADGVNWYEIQDLRTLRSDRFTRYEIDLDAAVAQCGLAYGPEFRIRFCQVDNNPAPMDGIFVHGILLTGEFPGLYVHLAMDDNAADPTVRDASPAGRHQTFVDPGGDPNTSAHSVPGVVGAALAFDGVDDQINLGADFASDILGYAHDFTYSIWAKAPSSAPAETQYVLSKHYKAEISFKPDSSTTLMIWPGSNLATSIPNSMDGDFHHFVILRRGETIELCYDGDLIRTDTDPSHLVALNGPTLQLKLGIRFNNTGPYLGVIDDFRMYDRALSGEEIEAMFGAGAAE